MGALLSIASLSYFEMSLSVRIFNVAIHTFPDFASLSFKNTSIFCTINQSPRVHTQNMSGIDRKVPDFQE